MSLFRTEEEVARLVGVGEEKWRELAKSLEKEGFPRRNPRFCNRRYWPACRLWLDRHAGLVVDSLAAGGSNAALVEQRENW